MHTLIEGVGYREYKKYQKSGFYRLRRQKNQGVMVFEDFRGDSEDNPQPESNKRRKIDTQERERAGARAPHRVRERVPATG